MLQHLKGAGKKIYVLTTSTGAAVYLTLPRLILAMVLNL